MRDINELRHVEPIYKSTSLPVRPSNDDPPSILPFPFHSFYDDRYDGLDPKFRLEFVGGFPIRTRTHGAELSCSLFNGWSSSFCVSVALTFKFHDPFLFAEFAT